MGAAPIVLHRPTGGPQTQGYGDNPDRDIQPGGHGGIDFGYTDDAGTVYPDVWAAAAGTVLFAGDSRALGWPNKWYFNPDFDRSDAADDSAGNVVVLGHWYGVTTYSHLLSIDVAAGQPVTVGTRLGTKGATGRARGKHLHFELILYPFNFATPTYGRTNPGPYLMEDDMFTAADRLKLDQIHAVLFEGSNETPHGQTVYQRLAVVQADVSAIKEWTKPIERYADDGQTIVQTSIRQEIADVRTVQKQADK